MKIAVRIVVVCALVIHGQAMPALFEPTIENKDPSPFPAPEGMVWIPGGEFPMASRFGALKT